MNITSARHGNTPTSDGKLYGGTRVRLSGGDLEIMQGLLSWALDTRPGEDLEVTDADRVAIIALYDKLGS